MLRLAADENFNNAILRGLRRRNPNLDIVRVQDVGLSGASDPVVLQWAAEEDRVLLTHDVTTMTSYAIQRVERSERMPGLIQVSRIAPVGAVIGDILLLAEASHIDEWEGQVIHLPLR